MDDMFSDEDVTHEDSHTSNGSRMEDVVLSNPPARLDVEHNSAAPTLRTTDDQRSVPVVAPMRSFEGLGNRAENTMRSADEDEAAEAMDHYELEISVTNPEKSGEGMGAYITYTVNTRTSLPSFRSSQCSVHRRYSDFLALYQKLEDMYSHLGRIVPAPPEKSVVGMTMVKLSKNEESGAPFIERRRAGLERFLNRVAKHPILRKDDSFRDFLENPDELPKAKDTSAVSGAGFMRLVKNVGDSIVKITGKKPEVDEWFDMKAQDYEVLDDHLKKLLRAVEHMVEDRKDLCASTGAFVKSVALLGSVEENETIAKALSRLSEVEEKVESLHQEMSQHDRFLFGETVKDYISLLGSIRICFDQRTKEHNNLLAAQSALAKKKESEVKTQASGKADKIAIAEQEVREWEEKEHEYQKAFDSTTKVLKAEIQRFERERSQEFKQKFMSYLERLMNMQQELTRLWESYLPDAQAIA